MATRSRLVSLAVTGLVLAVCAGNTQGSTFTIAGPVIATLNALPGIDWVKLYDASGETGSPTTGPTRSPTASTPRSVALVVPCTGRPV